MIYKPQKYKIEDRPMEPFIDEGEIIACLNQKEPSKERVREIIAKSLGKNRLTLEETAALINTKDPELKEEIKNGAKELKQLVYGKRIVLFAPLYVGNLCSNDCAYCGFKVSNKEMKRQTLDKEELANQVKALERQGHKRLVLAFGEHPKYNAGFIADSVREVYATKHGTGEIRRVNINAAPFDIEGFRKIKEAEIGTYQIFQETYHHDTYAALHGKGKKSKYDWRLTSLDRAQEAGIDDVGIGALFGLYDWRYEVLGLIRHVNHLEAVYNVGPHTISFPRIQEASALSISKDHLVSDEDFTGLVAILRLAVPYTGLILTAREPEHIRNEVIQYGISQIDGGSNIRIGGYAKAHNGERLDKEQFQLNDKRTLNDIMEELIEKEQTPSFCTACYRLGRTGEHFMELSVPGFIKRFCHPNALLTMAEYLEDYAPDETKEKGYKLIHKNLVNFEDEQFKKKLVHRLKDIKEGKRDIYF